MRTNRVKIMVDLLLGIGLILLLSYQVVGEEGHEWTGIVMTVLMLIHQVLNRKWYAALFKGKYSPLRIAQTAINLALLGCFLLTTLSGINMGVYAVPSLAEFMKASAGRRMHLALSHWSFILMGLHLGLHTPAMLRGVKSIRVRRIGYCLSVPAAGAGLYFFWAIPTGGRPSPCRLPPSWNPMISAERSSSRSALTEADALDRA